MVLYYKTLFLGRDMCACLYSLKNIFFVLKKYVSYYCAIVFRQSLKQGILQPNRGHSHFQGLGCCPHNPKALEFFTSMVHRYLYQYI